MRLAYSVLLVIFLISCETPKKSEINFAVQVDSIPKVTKNLLFSDYSQRALYYSVRKDGKLS
jgi:hypothetical protein